MNDVTRILSQIERGDPSAAEQLLPLVYEELRKLAAAKLSQEKPGHTLQATALVHEAYLRLVDVEKAQQWDSRGHFFSAAAEAMRRILIENARRKARVKHAGEMQRQDPGDLAVDCGYSAEDLLELDDLITLLEQKDPIAAQTVKLRFFAGMNHQEVGETLGISAVTSREHWRYARAWLHRQLQDGKPS